ncbi:hypothetical protein ACFWA9_04745 [Kitasatospora sp. NPDC059973]|uniref:hypothetical protein n=1 Tax=Kitasatospora sp. NPDC059973 TaxID=3347020 RepID=UPI0036B8644A
MISDRCPLYRPFSEPATDSPAPVDGRAWLLAVERAPFLEPALDDIAVSEAAPGGRRRLGPGALAGPADGSDG